MEVKYLNQFPNTTLRRQPRGGSEIKERKEREHNMSSYCGCDPEALI